MGEERVKRLDLEESKSEVSSCLGRDDLLPPRRPSPASRSNPLTLENPPSLTTPPSHSSLLSFSFACTFTASSFLLPLAPAPALLCENHTSQLYFNG